MDRRTKILAIAFGAVTAYLALAKVVYPNWLEPLLSLDERVAERREVLDRLESLDHQVMQARPEYRDYVVRIGSFDAQSVVTDVRDRLNGLIQKHALQNAGVSPGTPRSNRKTGVETIVITVTAVGLLESAVGFLRDVAELPHLMRVGNVAMYPSKSSKSSNRKRGQEFTHLRVPIELLVLPQQKVVGRIELEGLTRPESWVRHEGRDYSMIWSGTPFTQYIPPKPIKVNVGRDVTVKVGRSAKLRASVKGGDKQYTYEWSPQEGLKNIKGPNVEVDTTTPFTRSYTLTVTDGMGMSASDAVQVTVNERQKKKTTARPDKKPPKPRD
ncbi:MAG: PKD domain-containing protein, partial [Planctomycetes bacterium]|nr:PKD domain-containing protein [Planctomycetota bacterium]